MFFGLYEDYFTNLCKSVFVEERLSVVHNERHYLGRQVSSFLKLFFSKKLKNRSLLDKAHKDKPFQCPFIYISDHAFLVIYPLRQQLLRYCQSAI
jgi:hypothetical protein